MNQIKTPKLIYSLSRKVYENPNSQVEYIHEYYNDKDITHAKLYFVRTYAGYLNHSIYIFPNIEVLIATTYNASQQVICLITHPVIALYR